ncbi:MAG: ATP-binding protein, partial [Desulfobulbaceae bacterium]|nr:ATP-binding protein [Desulfobulbaceae bacterium]
LGCLLSRSKSIESVLKSLNKPQARIWVVDAGSRIRGRFGSFHPDNEITTTKQNRIQQLITLLHRPLQPLYDYFMEPYAKDFIDHKTQRARLDLKGIEEGLKGQSSISTYHIPDQQVEVMAAITPLVNDSRIIGAVVVEQTTNSILALKNRVIEESIDFTVLAFSIGGICLLLFASRLSSRIKRLRDQAAGAITPNGRIIDTVKPLQASDEVGDLSRALATMLTHLKQQSEYREKMADNLEHEMRTPMAAVSASLKNLANEMGVSKKGREYAQWAMRDMRRLEDLLTAIRDATTLKEALIQDFPESFDLGEATEMWLTHSWQPAFPNRIFKLNRSPDTFPLLADPGRIRQVLDKLVENGIDFSQPDSPLKITLQRNRNIAEIRVTNLGKELTPEMLGQIFNSMVSIRSQNDTKPHLGLGLFIVRTVVEHYNGTVTASPLPEPDKGAEFKITLPLDESS